MPTPLFQFHVSVRTVFSVLKKIPFRDFLGNRETVSEQEQSYVEQGAEDRLTLYHSIFLIFFRRYGGLAAGDFRFRTDSS
ncbi:hypothetical protein [Desulfolutivibrio sulfoxidireducens]|uniref:hypothetical protein n=1 Tax=Desulfolutivibrio sulfoxidireducens TaxID=2773299 RepID=UPI00159DE336|nr:hypothetical protein [Desulfolutivibrio sulfoxidireducens]QLA15441.1 hypothetical protein GD605_04440 [Desulfolutivibrio sulfoxidireducens]